MLLIALFGLLLAVQVNCQSANFRCGHFFEVFDEWQDGYRGMLRLPVLDHFTKMKDEMQNGDVIVRFTQPVFAVDIPKTEKRREVVSPDGRTYRNFIKFKYNELWRLQKGDVYELEMTVHFSQYQKGKIGVEALQFGKFKCPAIKATARPQSVLPPCRIIKVDDSEPDGYRANMTIPIGLKHYYEWNVEVQFNRPLLSFDVADAEKINPQERNVYLFKMYNRPYNGDMWGPWLNLQFMVHFDDLKVKKKHVDIYQIKFNGEVKCRSRKRKIG